MPIYEREPQFRFLGLSLGNKKDQPISPGDFLQIKEDFDGENLNVSLRGSGRWNGGYMKIVDPDTVILGRYYDTTSGIEERFGISSKMGIEVTVIKEQINKHPLVGQLLYWSR